MNYKLIHDSIIDRAKNRVLPKEVYTERHHIIPRCMGGSNDKSNLVDLTAKEHFIVHKLLVMIFPGNNSLFDAFWCMSNMNNTMGRNYRVGAREFNRIRNEYSKIQSERLKGEGNPFFNKTHNEDSISKMKAAAKHRPTQSEETKYKRSVSLKGHKNNLGVKHTDKSIESFRDSNPRNKKVSIDGVIYRSVRESGRQLGIPHETITQRIKSKNFINYQYV